MQKVTHMTTNYVKKYCNRKLIVQVILENVVTCFSGTQCNCIFQHCFQLKIAADAAA